MQPDYRLFFHFCVLINFSTCIIISSYWLRFLSYVSVTATSQNRQEGIAQQDTVEAPKRRRITQPVTVAVVRTRKKVDLSRDKSHMAQSLAAIFCESAEFIGTAEVPYNSLFSNIV